jgi:ATP-dependent Clp protease ATP-binding subunit ClpX
MLEHALLDVMFELPSQKGVAKVVIDENQIVGDAKPILIYGEQPKVSGSN